MTTPFKFATYDALFEASEQASQKMKALEQYLNKTSNQRTKKHVDTRSTEHRPGHRAKKDEKVAA